MDNEVLTPEELNVLAAICIATNKPEGVSPDELEKYKQYYAEKHNTKPEKIEIKSLYFQEDGTVDVHYVNKAEEKVERIRRISGYLSNLDNWNDGKRAEEKDRVKHI